MRLESWAQARRQIAEMVDRVNADPDLARAAAANPLLAIEELGYDIAPAVRREFEERIRFGQEIADERAALLGEIHRHAGRSFDVDSPEELEEVLHSDLGIGHSSRKREVAPLRIDELSVQPSFLGQPGRDRLDPLSRYEGQHPIIKPLLRYRLIEANEPRLASQQTFEQIRKGVANMPGVRVKFRVRSGRK
jgi:hypothetical protein